MENRFAVGLNICGRPLRRLLKCRPLYAISQLLFTKLIDSKQEKEQTQ